MNLKQLRIFRAVVEAGSFHGAANKLHLTQPAISHQLKSLEEEVGESLVLRSRPRVLLLPAGAAVLAAADRIEAELDELKLRFAPQESGALAGKLRVAASTLGIIYLYGDLLESFIARYPDIELVLTAAESGIGGARHVLAGTSDVAFSPFPVDLPNLESTLLAETEHVAIVSRSHPLAAKKRVSVDELRRYPFIRYQTDAGSRAISDQVFLPSGGFPPIFMESNDTEFIKRIVALGIGAAMVPAFTVTDEGRDRRLVRLRVGGVAVRQGFGLVCRRGIRMRTLRLFQEFCVEHCATIGTHDRVAPDRPAARRQSKGRR